MVASGPDPRHLGALARLRHLASDTIVYGLASAISKSFALVLFPFLTRNLSVADYGRLDLALFGAMLLGIAIVWGHDSAVARLFFEDDDVSRRRSIISQALASMAINAVALLVFLAVTWKLLPAERMLGSDARPMMILIAIYAPLSGLLSFCQSLLKWTFRRNSYLMVALGMPVTTLAGILLLATTRHFDLLTAFATMIAASALFCVLGVWMIRGWLVRPRDLAAIRILLPLALPYGLVSAISAVIPFAERSLVTGQFGVTDLGLYAVAAKIASIASIAALAFQMGWGPFSYAIYRQEDATRTYNLILCLFCAGIGITVLLLSSIAAPLIELLAGERYRSASLLVFPIAMAFGIQAIGWITELGIHLSKRSHLNLIGFSAFLIVSLGGMVILSRALGIIGVPLGALAGQLAMMLISACVAQRAYPISWQYGLPATSLLITLTAGGIGTFADAGTATRSLIYGLGAVIVFAANLGWSLRAGNGGRAVAMAKEILSRGRPGTE